MTIMQREATKGNENRLLNIHCFKIAKNRDQFCILKINVVYFTKISAYEKSFLIGRFEIESFHN